MGQTDWATRWQEETAEFNLGDDKVKDFLDSEQINALGIKCGVGSYLHKTALCYFPEKIRIGNFTRIDAYSILSPGDGFIEIGNYSHISSYVMLMGSAGITLKDYACIGANGKLFSVSDSFSGHHFIGPMVSMSMRNVKSGHIVMEKYTCLGVNCTIMPGTILKEGCLVHANSLLRADKPMEEYKIMAGSPAVAVRDRPKTFLQYLQSHPLHP